MIRFHFCEQFERKIKKNKNLESIKDKIKEYENRKNLKNISTFLSLTDGIYIFKIGSQTLRVIIQEKKIVIEDKNVNVFFVRDIILSKNFDRIYRKKLLKLMRNGNWLKENPLSDNDKNNFKKEYLTEKKESLEKRKNIPEYLTSWLNNYELKITHDIFEMKSWVNYALGNNILDGMQDKHVNMFRIVLSEIIENDLKENIFSKTKKDIEIYLHQDKGIAIFYSKCNIDNKSIYILYNGAHLSSQKKHFELIKDNLKNNSFEFSYTLEDISRASYRAYPKWTIKNDNDTWFDIEKSSELNNLSLTIEQLDFFKNFKFPYYINGQAGSGKSTMLYYLFANSYWYQIFQNNNKKYSNDKIIFLTENKNLLENTKKAVKGLLTANPEFDLGNSPETIENSSKSFFTFKDFLLSLISDKEKIKFPNNKYLTFPIFKLKYENSYLANEIKDKYSAEESWFTIITYIYGYQKDKINSENYETIIPKKSRIISKNRFKDIEKDILPFYDKLINEKGYWNKLTIISYINENIDIIKKYDVVICDEAQDFSKLELNFILKLSKYLDYDLKSVEQVPILFAGDQNQTVNPTGFREKEIISMLYKELKEVAGFKKYDSVENIYNPSYNYRSTPPVVWLANFIQYFRMKNLDMKLTTPQKSKRPEKEFEKSNIFLTFKEIKNNTKLKKDLIKKLQHKIFIVPVDNQKIPSYKQGKLISEIDSAEIKSSVDAKGAEYQQVVLYGFGEYFLEKFESLKNPNSDTFAIKYFFNKLYVAITRAQTELLIIDSINSKENFWNKLIKINNIEESWKELINYRDKVFIFDSGINDIIKSTKKDTLKNAKEDEKQGDYEGNSSRLRVAGNQYLKIGYQLDAYRCFAKSEEIKENWEKAAIYYKKIDNLNSAAQCYFKAKEFDKVNDINLNTYEQEIRIILSKIVNNKLLDNGDAKLLEKKDIIKDILKDINWINILIDKIIQKIYEKNFKYKRELLWLLEDISYHDDDLNLSIAKIYYDLKDYENAIKKWDYIIDTNEDIEKSIIKDKKYINSKIKIYQNNESYENLIYWYYENFLITDDYKNISNIIDIYKSKTDIIKIDEKNFPILYRSYLLKLKDNGNLESIYKITQDIEREIDNLKLLSDFYKNILSDSNNFNINSEKTLILIPYILEKYAKLLLKQNNLINLEELNDFHKKISGNYNIPYIKFTVEEISSFSNKQVIPLKPNIKYSKLIIKNFRQYKEIMIKDIGEFNLILGDNNIGKTSLLEALLFSIDKKEYLKNLSIAFIERKNLPLYSKDNEDYYKIKEKYLKSFINNESEEKIISYTIFNNRYKWNYLFDFKNIKIEDKINSKNIIEVPLISYGKGFGTDLAKVYNDKIDKNKKTRKEFINNMKVFIPDIERISVDTSNGDIFIEENTHDENYPLHQYGEGANKLFRILVEIFLQKDKFLLIDEIDAGIHYSRFYDFWRIILKVAKKNNVQIFATTHNAECIDYFKDILQDNDYKEFQDDSRIITLEKLSNGEIESFTRFFNEFEYELEENLEIRGGE